MDVIWRGLCVRMIGERAIICAEFGNGSTS